MTADLFISYAWTSDAHRRWVRLLASTLHSLGYEVLIDADVDYGDSLTGFMRRVSGARHVLMVADTNYVQRANSEPDSGVAVENRHLEQARPSNPSTWLAVLAVDNPDFEVPAWLKADKPKGFDFNADPAGGEFPGSEQIEDLWRWMEDLPSDRSSSVSQQELRQRRERLERIAALRDPATWRNSALTGAVHFEHRSATAGRYTLGFGEWLFVLRVSDEGSDSVHVYADPKEIDAVGVVRGGAVCDDGLQSHLTPGDQVSARVGDTVVLMNSCGALCRVDVVAVQQQVQGPEYVASYMDFAYRVLGGSSSIV